MSMITCGAGREHEEDFKPTVCNNDNLQEKRELIFELALLKGFDKNIFDACDYGLKNSLTGEYLQKLYGFVPYCESNDRLKDEIKKAKGKVSDSNK